MQAQTNWKVAANLELLCGNTFPSEQVHTDYYNKAINNDEAVADTNKLFIEGIENNNDNSSNSNIDVRNTCNIDDMFYGGVQDVMTSVKVREQLIRYYYYMMSKIDVRDDVMLLNAEINNSNTLEETEEKESEQQLEEEEQEEETHAIKTNDNADNCELNDENKQPILKKEEELEYEQLNAQKQELLHKDTNIKTTIEENEEQEMTTRTLKQEKTSKTYSFRARGILTELHDPSPLSTEALLPWEFYVINTNATSWFDNDDDDMDSNSVAVHYREQYEDEIRNSVRVQEYSNAFRALVNENVLLPAFLRTIVEQSTLHNNNNSSGEAPMRNANTQSNVQLSDGIMTNYSHGNANNYGDVNTSTLSSKDSIRYNINRLSLYTRLAEPFTGVYPGMAVGVIGEPFQWSATGVLTGVLVHKFVLPSKPRLPWNIHHSRDVSSSIMKNEKERCPDKEECLYKHESCEHLQTEKELSEKDHYEVIQGRYDANNNNNNIGNIEMQCTRDFIKCKTTPIPMRIHFCSGPFPRRDTHALLRMVVTQALQREADLLIIGGPLIKPFEEEFDKELLPLLNATFSDLLDGYIDVIEETIQQWQEQQKQQQEEQQQQYHLLSSQHIKYNIKLENSMNATLESLTRVKPCLKVILIPHRDDVTQFPVLPQTLYALSDTEDIYMRSNPCRLCYRGVHIGICNDDAVGMMQEQMVERWPHTEGNLRRVVETVVQSRLYSPIMQLPCRTVDLRYLNKLWIDYQPRRRKDDNNAKKALTAMEVNNVNGDNELRDVEMLERKETSKTYHNNSSNNNNIEQIRNKENMYKASLRGNWNYLKEELRLSQVQWMQQIHSVNKLRELSATKRVKLEKDEIKREDDDDEEKITTMQQQSKTPINASFTNAMREIKNVEYMPHIIFLPSTRPRFALVTHRGVHYSTNDDDASDKSIASLTKIVDEANVDDVDNATGVLVINQEVWSRRTSAQFALRVAEVTMDDSKRVALCGARASTGVSCGLLHIFNAAVEHH